MASFESLKRLSKEPAKDLATLVALLRSSDVKLEIDWENFMKLTDAPTKPAARMRVQRLAKSLEIDVFGNGSRGGSKATKGPTTPKTAGKRKPASVKPKTEDEEEEENEEEAVEQELQESPLKKKAKSEEKASQITDQDEESRSD